MPIVQDSDFTMIIYARFALAVAVSLAGTSIVSGCDAAVSPEPGMSARINTRNVEVTQVPIRVCPWDPFGRVAENPAMTLVERIVAGDVAGADAILSRGGVGVNDVICLTISEILRRGKLNLEQTLFNPPYLGNRGVHRLDCCYIINQSLDAVLGPNDQIEFYGTPLMLAARRGDAAMVSFLLKQGANPNVFVRTKGIVEQLERQLVGSPIMQSGRRPCAVLCALTECYVQTSGKFVESGDECAALLIKHGASMPPSNSQGQTALWAAAQARSTFLLEQFVKMGADVNHKDALGMTVADYVLREVSTASGNLRREYETFLSALQAHGAKTNVRAGGDAAAPNVGMRQTFAIPQPVQAITPKQDHSAEIAAIEAQLRELRMQLVEAKHDAKMNAINGTAALSAQMRVMSLIDAIHERERKLAALQEASRP